jgi:2-keto-3-deoxy-L-rhamnonate aldolase RhmA
MDRLDGRAAVALQNDALALGRALREKAAANTVLGTFIIELPTPGAIRAAALAGFDFVVLDLEHSAFGIADLPPLITEAQRLGCAAIVRIWSYADPALLSKILDSGANGVLVPRIGSAGDARKIVRHCRYAPLGERGLAPLLALSQLGRPQVSVDRDILVIVQIEGVEALADIDRIAATPGIDGVFVGPFDLSQALGRPGEIDHPEVAAAAETVAAASHDLLSGIYVHDPAASAGWSERGFNFQCLGIDGKLLFEAMRRAVADASPRAEASERLLHS